MKMHSLESFWEYIKEAFIYDDGSLPTIELGNITGDEIINLFSVIISKGKPIDGSAYWDRINECETLIESVPNAAKYVVEDTADSIHFCTDDLTCDGVILPTIGIFIFSDSIEFDYRMGDEWTQEKVLVFFRFLIDLKSKTKKGILRPAENEGPDDPELILMGLSWVEDNFA